ncbi:MAG: NrtA/SsuA/CpmA family ABC transporter substrate-binding protein [Dysgonamonadaceae bacterium]|jgi:ABC-type nitrate/sulfonate/bicarbonate transport system substrate-binding protein|nr:NrtA/SsuA/CpmA family ABC transporter substrate-binding protein [Dysgonamonadaceae bacterium]
MTNISPNSKKIKRFPLKTLGISLVVLAVLFSVFYLFKNGNNEKSDTRLVVGWQTAWATAGQIIETLDHTNITTLYGSSATFRNFLYGPDMIEAGLGGDIDATTLGIVPIISLLAINDDWTVVCRLIDFSTTTIAKDGSGIETFADIKGKKLGVPFGASGAYPYILLRMEENGMTTQNTKLVNVSPAEAIVVLQQGGIDALGIWEPTSTIIESKGIGKVIDEKRYIGFVAVKRNLVENNPDEVVALIKSLIEANWYVVQNRKQTDEWFAKRSNFDLDLLNKIRIIEPNLKAQSVENISVTISQEDIALSQQVADQMLASDLLPRKVNFAERVNNELAKQATEEIRKAGSKINQVILKGE